MAVYNIVDYGAKADGVTVCTKAIQRAIDLCDQGGTVLIPAGTFISGAIYLKSNMTLYLEKGAKLLGSSDIADFPLCGYPYEGFDQLCYASLINTDGAPYHDITIAGEGVIDANGAVLFKQEMAEARGKRGRAVCIRNTERVTIRGVSIRQSPAWCLHLIFCRDVLLDSMEVHSKYDENGKQYEGIYNGDGIDIDSCKNVRVVNSLIASQDDCIAVKSGRNEMGRRVGIPSEDIVIENCRFHSGFGVAMGSEMSGGVRNVLVRNCVFEDSFSIASVKTMRGRGNYIRDVRYENCSLINRDPNVKVTRWFRGAIYFDCFYGHEEYDADLALPVDETTPVIENVELKNITVDTIEGHAIYLCGLPEAYLKNIRLENIKAKAPYGIYRKNIEGLELINVDVCAVNE